MAKTVRTSTAPPGDHPDLHVLAMAPGQARSLHRLVAHYNVQGETHGSPSYRPEPALEEALLRLVTPKDDGEPRRLAEAKAA